jgi:UDP-N-acetylglucosamine kinase
MTPEEESLCDGACAYAREHKKRIGRELTDPNVFTPEQDPVSVFMASSPGAGKTEASKELIAEFEAKSPSTRVLRIDPDDLRCMLPGYDGSNSWLFQRPVSV